MVRALRHSIIVVNERPSSVRRFTTKLRDPLCGDQLRKRFPGITDHAKRMLGPLPAGLPRVGREEAPEIRLRGAAFLRSRTRDENLRGVARSGITGRLRYWLASQPESR